MAPLRIRNLFLTIATSLTVAILILSAKSGHAQLDLSPCEEALGYAGCDALIHPNRPQITYHFAAIAHSAAKNVAGASHGESSLDAAEQTALKNCASQGAKDCEVVRWVQNQCTAVALSSAGDAGWSFGSPNRDDAALFAVQHCKSVGAKDCRVVAAPCADDDARWPAPLPLPPGGTTATIDPNAVGIWVYVRNPGLWVWKIAANGTYEFHSEAGDGAPSQAGTISARQGAWSIQAENMKWADAGTYKFQSANTMIATGKLGTGTWHRVNYKDE